ncbi:phage/plasmid primase, P4 family [Microbacterium esteraromaticum]|uniref:DNA primase family protein n=1 Tax=Microbacterium esteraromaticum TaxID=57043 RepID=UPI002367E915|nr:phage/plasmid primase, P4 family [Microbacterium esteraromaticum]WDH78237.1 phage/plasmid primase, P4 family [Microbacterium esteraromaticum]
MSQTVEFQPASEPTTTTTTAEKAGEIPLSPLIDNVLLRSVERYLDRVAPAPGESWPDAITIKESVIGSCNDYIAGLNAQLTGRDRHPKLKALHNAQIATILARVHRVVGITPDASSINRDALLLGMYQHSGPELGCYTTDEATIRAVAMQYNMLATERDHREILALLRVQVDVVTQNRDRDLIAVNNGIFNYMTKELHKFDPEVVFLNKVRTDWNPSAQSPQITMHDGQVWEFDAWLLDLFNGDAALTQLMLQAIGACVRPYVRWKKTALLFDERGNNGKGTLLELIRGVLGPGGFITMALSEFHGFHMERLTRGGTILCDENNESYMNDLMKLKAVITGDPIHIDRKNRLSVEHQHNGFMIQCVNSLPKLKDRTGSMKRRLLPIPFSKSFTGVERSYIRDDYMTRPDVREYVLKLVLSGIPDYYEFADADASREALHEQMLANSAVRQFWESVEPFLVWDLVPYVFLYDLYKAWLTHNNPSSHPLSRLEFDKEFFAVVAEDAAGPWEAHPDRRKVYRTGTKMDEPEPLIARYDLHDWMNQNYAGNDPRRIVAFAKAPRYKGAIVRRVPKAVQAAAAGIDEED